MRRRAFLARAAQAAAGFGLLRHLGACRPGADEAGSAGGAFATLRERYFVRTLQLNPVVSTYLGGDGYSPALAGVNGRLRDYSPAALEDERAFYRRTREELDRIPAADLTPQERIDRSVMTAQIDFVLRQLDEVRQHQRAIDTYVAEPFRGVDWQIQQMRALDGGLLGTEEEWTLVGARLAQVPRYLEQARANLSAGKEAGNLPDRRLVARDGIGGSEANARYFRTTLPETARRFLGDRPFARRALARVTEAGIAAADAYRAFGAFLRSAYDPGDTADRFAAGEEEYEWRVRRCLRVDRSPAELYDYGARQVERYESRVFEVAEAVAREAGLGLRFGTPEQRRTSVRRVLEHLGTDSPADDDELFRWFRETGDRAVRYGREQGLFDVPADYRLDIAPTPPVLRSTIDAAYYPAPPFKRSGVGRFYLTPTGNDPARLALANRASVATLSCHEGFPGHDWHYKFMTEHAAKISNVRWLTMGSVEDSSSMWADSMATEGWALYAEELMAEPVAGRPHGFYHAAEYLYMVQAQLLRAVRVRVDVGIHTGRMSFAEAREYFAEPVAFLPAACARAAAGDAAAKAVCDQADRAIYRYSKWPTQAITYDLGKNEIRELREATVTSPAELRRFHELLLAMGTIPAAHFREGFLSARRPA